MLHVYIFIWNSCISVLKILTDVALRIIEIQISLVEAQYEKQLYIQIGTDSWVHIYVWIVKLCFSSDICASGFIGQ